MLELDLKNFLIFLRDAVIYNNMQSKKGMEWLDNAWILEQKSPDRKSLRENFGERR